MSLSIILCCILQLLMMPMCGLACLEGKVVPHNGTLKDRPTIDLFKLASTHIDEFNADPPPLPVFSPEDLIGHTFLMDEQEHPQQLRGQIVNLIDNQS
jgi:hypothetical protein